TGGRRVQRYSQELAGLPFLHATCSRKSRILCPLSPLRAGPALCTRGGVRSIRSQLMTLCLISLALLLGASCGGADQSQNPPAEQRLAPGKAAPAAAQIS